MVEYINYRDLGSKESHQFNLDSITTISYEVSTEVYKISLRALRDVLFEHESGEVLIGAISTSGGHEENASGTIVRQSPGSKVFALSHVDDAEALWEGDGVEVAGQVGIIEEIDKVAGTVTLDQSFGWDIPTSFRFVRAPLKANYNDEFTALAVNKNGVFVGDESFFKNTINVMGNNRIAFEHDARLSFNDEFRIYKGLDEFARIDHGPEKTVLNFSHNVDIFVNGVKAGEFTDAGTGGYYADLTIVNIHGVASISMADPVPANTYPNLILSHIDVDVPMYSGSQMPNMNIVAARDNRGGEESHEWWLLAKNTADPQIPTRYLKTIITAGEMSDDIGPDRYAWAPKVELISKPGSTFSSEIDFVADKLKVMDQSLREVFTISYPGGNGQIDFALKEVDSLDITGGNGKTTEVLNVTDFANVNIHSTNILLDGAVNASGGFTAASFGVVDLDFTGEEGQNEINFAGNGNDLQIKNNGQHVASVDIFGTDSIRVDLLDNFLLHTHVSTNIRNTNPTTHLVNSQVDLAEDTVHVWAGDTANFAAVGTVNITSGITNITGSSNLKLESPIVDLGHSGDPITLKYFDDLNILRDTVPKIIAADAYLSLDFSTITATGATLDLFTVNATGIIDAGGVQTTGVYFKANTTHTIDVEPVVPGGIASSIGLRVVGDAETQGSIDFTTNGIFTISAPNPSPTSSLQLIRPAVVGYEGDAELRLTNGESRLSVNHASKSLFVGAYSASDVTIGSEGGVISIGSKSGGSLRLWGSSSGNPAVFESDALTATGINASFNSASLVNTDVGVNALYVSSEAGDTMAVGAGEGGSGISLSAGSGRSMYFSADVLDAAFATASIAAATNITFTSPSAIFTGGLTADSLSIEAIGFSGTGVGSNIIGFSGTATKAVLGRAAGAVGSFDITATDVIWSSDYDGGALKLSHDVATKESSVEIKNSNVSVSAATDFSVDAPLSSFTSTTINATAAVLTVDTLNCNDFNGPIGGELGHLTLDGPTDPNYFDMVGPNPNLQMRVNGAPVGSLLFNDGSDTGMSSLSGLKLLSASGDVLVQASSGLVDLEASGAISLKSQQATFVADHGGANETSLVYASDVSGNSSLSTANGLVITGAEGVWIESTSPAFSARIDSGKNIILSASDSCSFYGGASAITVENDISISTSGIFQITGDSPGVNVYNVNAAAPSVFSFIGDSGVNAELRNSSNEAFTPFLIEANPLTAQADTITLANNAGTSYVDLSASGISVDAGATPLTADGSTIDVTATAGLTMGGNTVSAAAATSLAMSGETISSIATAGLTMSGNTLGVAATTGLTVDGNTVDVTATAGLTMGGSIITANTADFRISGEAAELTIQNTHASTLTNMLFSGPGAAIESSTGAAAAPLSIVGTPLNITTDSFELSNSSAETYLAASGTGLDITAPVGNMEIQADGYIGISNISGGSQDIIIQSTNNASLSGANSTSVRTPNNDAIVIEDGVPGVNFPTTPILVVKASTAPTLATNQQLVMKDAELGGSFELNRNFPAPADAWPYDVVTATKPHYDGPMGHFILPDAGSFYQVSVSVDVANPGGTGLNGISVNLVRDHSIDGSLTVLSNYLTLYNYETKPVDFTTIVQGTGPGLPNYYFYILIQNDSTDIVTLYNYTMSVHRIA